MAQATAAPPPPPPNVRAPERAGALVRKSHFPQIRCSSKCIRLIFIRTVRGGGGGVAQIPTPPDHCGAFGMGGREWGRIGGHLHPGIDVEHSECTCVFAGGGGCAWSARRRRSTVCVCERALAPVCVCVCGYRLNVHHVPNITRSFSLINGGCVWAWLCVSV